MRTTNPSWVQDGVCVQRSIWHSSSVCLTDEGTIFTFQWSSLSAPPFHAPLLQAMAGVVSLALCLHVVPQAPNFWHASHLWWLLCPPVCLTGHFPWQWPVLGGTSSSFSKHGVKHWHWNPTRSYIVSCSGWSLQAEPGSWAIRYHRFPSRQICLHSKMSF